MVHLPRVSGTSYVLLLAMCLAAPTTLARAKACGGNIPLKAGGDGVAGKTSQWDI